MERAGYHQFGVGDLDECPPHDHEILVHLVPEASRLKWNHIEDLDSFFTRVYYYHQKHGFFCVLMQETFELIQFIFVIVFASFLMQCVDYQILFKDKPVAGAEPNAKVTLDDVLIPAGTCVAGFGFMMWSGLFIALIFWIIRFIFVTYNTVLNWETRAFYRTALCFSDRELDNLTWYDVQKKLREVQREQQMCIHKQDLTELDIYHRILRFKNYMIAMTNKSLLPLKFNVPIIGDIVFLTHGMKYNLELLLFWGPWAPFENSWHLRENYKKVSKRKELADALRKRIVFVAFINLILSPVIFLWQILYSFFNYAEVVKREPGTLGMRRWSLYGRLYLRHFNELEHEINARLSRAYRPAAKYMSIFNAPALTIIAQNLAFIAGALLAVLSLLAIYDEDVLTVEHVLLLISASGAVIAVCRAFIPDEQLVWCPERLLTAVLALVHYSPDHWKRQAHTSHTRDEFALLFEYKAVYLILELLSPFVTPIILFFHLRHKSLAIVDFYRNFTVDVVGVGDVCSFAQLDIRKHGNTAWQIPTYDMDGSSDQPSNNNNAYTQAENGKTELSLVHFTHTNPEWQPPQSSGAFITNLKERATREASVLPTVLEENPFYASLNSISSLGNEYSNAISNLIKENTLPNNPVLMVESVPPAEGADFRPMLGAISPQNQSSFRGFLSKHEGPMQRSINRGIVAGTQHCGSAVPSYNTSTISFANSFAHYPSPAGRGTNNSEMHATIEFNAIEMSLDALYLHEIHHQEMRRRNLPSGSTLTRPTMHYQPQLPTHLSQTNQTTVSGGNLNQLSGIGSQQPQVHGIIPHTHHQVPNATTSSASSGSGDSNSGCFVQNPDRTRRQKTEKTSLLSTKYTSYFDPLV